MQPTSENQTTVSKKVIVKGIAVRAGVSLNRIKYTAEELRKTAHELANKPILKDHKPTTDNTIGRTTKAEYHEDGTVPYEGWVIAAHSEPVLDGRVPNVSIGGFVDKLVQENPDDDYMVAEGIHYMELSTTPTPGVVGTSISAAVTAEAIATGKPIRESFPLVEKTPDDTKVFKEAPTTAHAREVEPMPEPQTSAVSVEEHNALKNELAALKEARKKELVAEIRKANPSMDEKSLFSESEDKLKLILEYEHKLAAKPATEPAKPKADIKDEAPKTPVSEAVVYNRGTGQVKAEPGQLVLERSGKGASFFIMPNYSMQGWNGRGN